MKDGQRVLGGDFIMAPTRVFIYIYIHIYKRIHVVFPDQKYRIIRVP